MEVYRRTLLIKHLEPARPLRRCTQADEPQMNAASWAQAVEPETTVDVEQFCKIVSLHQNKARLSYTRDFLIGLASCPEAMKKPQYLPEHPIVLTKARNPGHVELRLMSWSNGTGDISRET
ncbi:uncharacterized protein C8orf88 homolog [Austrofundulus limnaeus]|uniref:Uncharacterized protein C8orf88 homolog n=1 Tax=Austrofundulus limnaeus TaxID=52670 RepID=A0A2I4CK72_AUSLI|nr:PREDICTED: uncharacterized protein C8orf88 homolog [Austrofundulus limnaeus]